MEAAKIIDMPVTIGMEARISMDGTRLEGRRTNNPDQEGVSYMTIQSVPHDKIDRLTEFFRPYRQARHERNRKMVAKINELLSLDMDYERDVLPLSMAHEEGGVTERHLMYALAMRLMKEVGRGEKMVSKLTGMGLTLSEKQKAQMMDMEYPFYAYDLLGILKGAFVPQIFIPATDECPKLPDVVALCREVDAYLCYAYLGDVGDSVTGDKKAQKFEDDYLEDVFLCLEEEGVKSVTYMPTRNTPAQLDRLRGLCRQYGMFEISGEDINTPRQSFVIRAMEDPKFANLIEATWKLIEHEKQ